MHMASAAHYMVFRVLFSNISHLTTQLTFTRTFKRPASANVGQLVDFVSGNINTIPKIRNADKTMSLLQRQTKS